jgi:hypothetical protein
MIFSRTGHSHDEYLSERNRTHRGEAESPVALFQTLDTLTHADSFFTATTFGRTQLVPDYRDGLAPNQCRQLRRTPTPRHNNALDDERSVSLSWTTISLCFPLLPSLAGSASLGLAQSAAARTPRKLRGATSGPWRRHGGGLLGNESMKLKESG